MIQNDGNFVVRKTSDNSTVFHTVGVNNEISSLWNTMDLIHPSTAYYATGDSDFDSYAYARPCPYPYLFGHSTSVELTDAQGGGYWQFAHTMNWGSAYSAQLMFGVHGNMFFRTSDDSSGWSRYKKIIAAPNGNAKYDFDNLSFSTGSNYSEMVLPFYYYGESNFAGFGINSGGIPILRVGTAASNKHTYWFSTDGNMYIDNAYKVISTKNMSVSGTTLTITL